MCAEQAKDDSYILYGSPPSLYSGKIRSYLRKKGLPYRERLTCHPDYFGKIMPKVGRYVIPVLECPDGTIIQDTSEIIDFLEAHHQGPSVYPDSPKQKIVSLILELFGDEGMLRPAMHYRWNFPDDNDNFISLEFGRFMVPTAPDEEAKGLAMPVKARMSGLLPALGVTPDTIPVIEAAYADLLAALDAHFLEHPYVLGGRPTIADYGLYAPLYAHLSRDPAPSLLMKKNANRVWRWVERMTAPDLDKPEFPAMPDALLEADNIPDTLANILKLVATDYLPEIISLVDYINRYIDENDPAEGTAVITNTAKRSLGGFHVMIRDTDHRLVARHYSIWMLQRVQDAYAALTNTEKADVDTLLTSVGLTALTTHKCTRRIDRENHTEIWGKTL